MAIMLQVKDIMLNYDQAFKDTAKTPSAGRLGRQR